VISWIIGSHLGLNSSDEDFWEDERIINLEFIYASTIAIILYLVLNYRIAYEIISEKQKFRKQHIHTYGFGLLKFYIAWGIIYAILIFISSIFIIGGVRIMGFLTHINLFLSFLEFYLFQLATVFFSMLISSFFPRLPVVGGGLSVLLQLGSAIGYFAQTYFHDYKNDREELSQHSNLTSIANDMYEVKQAEKQGEIINFSNLFNHSYINIFVNMSVSLGDIFIIIVLAVFVDLFLVSIHASRSRADRKNKNYYLGLIENKYRSNPTVNSNSCQTSYRTSYQNLPRTTDRFLDRIENQELFKFCGQNNRTSINGITSPFAEMASYDGIAISAKHLFKEYQTNKIMAISNVTFDIYDHEIFVIAGPRNSGKSTLMKILYGRQSSSYGNVYYHEEGEKMKEMGYGKWRSLTRNIGVAPHEDYQFMEDLSVYDHIRFYQSVSPSEKEDGFVILKELNFQGQPSDLIKDLPRVERMKLKVALALLKFPKFIFLEEPTADMSEKDRCCFWEAMHTRSTHRVIVISTENMEEAVQHAQRIMVLRGGTIQSIGDSEYIKHRLSLIPPPLPPPPTLNPPHEKKKKNKKKKKKKKKKIFNIFL